MSAAVDETFEVEVRAMLARRAADIPEPAAGVVPPLPAGLRFSLEPPEQRSPRRSAFLAAAVFVLLLGAVGVIAVSRADGTRERVGPADAPTRPTGPMPDLQGLPQGLTTEDLLPLWTDPPGPERYARERDGMSNAPLALSRFLQVRMGGVASGVRHREIDGYPDWAQETFRTSSVGAAGPQSDDGTAYLWWSGESWSVMAVLSSAAPMDEVVVDSARVSGAVYGDGPARSAALGPQVEDLRLDDWSDHLVAVGRTSGSEAIVVDGPIPGGPVTFLVVPADVASDPPPSFAEIAFDAGELAAPDPAAAVPTLPGFGAPSPGTEVARIPVDAPIVLAVESALPEGAEVVAAQHRTGQEGNESVDLSTVVDGAGWDVSILPDLTAEEIDGGGAAIGGGRAWFGGNANSRSVTVLTDDGVALTVTHRDASGPAVAQPFVLAVAETLAGDPAVVAVAQGADPAG